MCDGSVFQDGFLGIRAFVIVGIAFVLFLIAHQPVLQHVPLTIIAELFTSHFSFLTPHDGPVGLVHLALGKHLVQTGKSLRRAGKDHEAADWTIQAMHHAEEHGPWLLVLLLQIVLYNIRKGAIASLVALHDLPTLFVDYDDMVVLVNDLHRLTCSYHHPPESPGR